MTPPTPKRCPYPHPCNLNYINIMWQRDSADRKLFCCRSSWVFWVGQSNHGKAENALQPESDLKHERHSACHYCRGHVESIRRNVCGQPARKWGHQSCDRKELNSVADQNKLGNRFLPVFSKECSPLDTLIWGLAKPYVEDPPTQGHLTSDL